MDDVGRDTCSAEWKPQSPIHTRGFGDSASALTLTLDDDFIPIVRVLGDVDWYNPLGVS